MRISILASVSFVVVGVACAKPTAFETDSDSGTPEADGDIPIGMKDGSAEAVDCTECSPDLRTVVACGTNQVVAQCTGDEGCGPNGCIPACDAAAANQSSIGCDYYAIPPDGWSASYFVGSAPGNCFAAFVTNAWATPLKVSLVWKGKTIDATPYSYIPKGSGTSITYQPIPATGIPPNGMAVVFLNQTQDSGGVGTNKVKCPPSVKAAIEDEDVVIHGTSVSNAIEIKTSVPATIYDIYPYGGAASFTSSASLLLPTNVWDTNYVAVTMEKQPVQVAPGIDLIAREDGTSVTVLPSTDITAANGVAGATKNNPVTYSINKGQTIHIMQLPDGTGNDLSGSIIQSTKPIGVWGEHFCMMHTHDPPKWRIVGTVDGTKLTYDPAVPAGPTTLKRGQLVEFDGPEAFYVKSQDDQHPFYFAAHRPDAGDCDAAHQQIPPIQALGNEYVAVANEATDYSYKRGGPETVNVVPPAQFLSEYLFFTDPTYGFTDLALVRVKASDNTFKDVTLDCLGTVKDWKSIGGTPYQYTHVDVQHNRLPVGGCDNGLHTLKSTGRIGITVWGYDGASSYAYPAGASVKPINTVVVPPSPN